MSESGTPIVPAAPEPVPVVTPIRAEPDECAVYGHDYIHTVALSGELLGITCERCPARWKVERA